MDTKKYIYAPERNEHHRLFENGVLLFLLFKRAWSCGVSIQLFFNATQWETNRTTRYVVITYIMGDAGWEFSGASHEIYQLNLFLTFRLCIIHLVGNSSSKNFFNIKTEIQLMIVKALARCFPHGSICTTLFSVFAVHHFWGEISQSPPLPP